MLTPVVVKVGGAALAEAGWLEALAEAVGSAARPVVIVHGGGPEISALSSRLGVGVEFRDGRRVTTDEGMSAVAMVLTGRINKRIVGALLNAGVDAVGLSGEDGGLLVASFAQQGALGRVGQVDRVRVDLLSMLLERGIVPVVSPVSRGPDGAALNVNADEAAAAIACALGAAELLFVTDVDGVRDGAAVLPSLSVAEADALVANGVARDGMVVKLTAARAAIAAGVAAVRIGTLAGLADERHGTRVWRGGEVAA